MTTLTTAARAERDSGVEPLPWRRMAWVTWRQHRVPLGGAVAFLGALALYVWVAGLHLHHAYAAAAACAPVGSAACADLARSLVDMNHFLVGGYVLQAVPALIGAFIGAPVLARELETGTFRYAWTQGYGRWRWALGKLVPLAVAVAAAAGAITVLFSWYYRPYFAAGNQGLGLQDASPFGSGLFDLRGVAFAAWTLAAFAVGALTGMVVRRVVPAIVATLAVYAGLAVATADLLRRHYLAPLLTSRLDVPGSAWILRQWWTKGGVFAFSSWRDAPHDLLYGVCAPPAGGPVGKPLPGTLSRCFVQQGYTQWTRYQPLGRFWPFQWIEGGWLLALSALLIAATVWLVRRRAT